MEAMSSAAERSLGRKLFKRCVQCPPESPQCPTSCPDDQICSLVPQDCNSCAHMTCFSNPSPAPTASGPNVGAIAGGVAAGVGFVGLVVFFVWLFWIKKRRAQQDKELEEEWEQDEIAFHQKRAMQFRALQTDAASTRTRASLATSILSRASNFIQIAYIPGVTNRDGSARNSIHAPVPPVPAMYRRGQTPAKSPLSNEGDTLFFDINDLRGSTYSGASSSVRNTRYSSSRDTRYTVNSITPSLARDSVASEVQWDDATTAPMPSTSLPRLAPRMVSVKATPNASTSESTPPLDHVSNQVKEVPIMVAGQGALSGSSIRGKATQVTLLPGSKKLKGRFPVRQPSDSASSSSAAATTLATLKHHAPLIPSPLAEKEPASAMSLDSDSEEEDYPPHARARDSLIQNIDFSTPPATSRTTEPTDSPFFDAADLSSSSAAITAASSTRPNPYASMASTVGGAGLSNDAGMMRMMPTKRRGGSRGKIGALSAVIEEGVRRASSGGGGGGEETPTTTGGGAARDPFGDEYEV